MKSLAILCVLFATQVFALDIPSKCHVDNQDPGYCAWVSLEILGKVHGIHELNNIVENRKKDVDTYVLNPYNQWEKHPKNLGYNYALRGKLTRLKVKFWMQDSGFYSRKLLKYSDSHGCLVAVKPGAIPGTKESHAIIITKYKDGAVTFYDCNKPDKFWVATKEWFDYYWTGLVIVVEK